MATKKTAKQTAEEKAIEEKKQFEAIATSLADALGIKRSSSGYVDRQEGLERVVIPSTWEPDQAIEVLQRERDERMSLMEFDYRIPCLPLDGARSLELVLKRTYGHVTMLPKRNFFWTEAPHFVTVPTRDGSVSVPWGLMSIHGVHGNIDVGYVVDDGIPHLLVSGEIERRSHDEVKEIMARVEQSLETESIYRGRALEVNLDWMTKRRFNPRADAPTFIPLGTTAREDVVLNQSTWDQLKMSLLGPITQTSAYEKLGLDTRSGVVLYGKPGTGKTHFLNYLANVCEHNSWTYLLVRDASQMTDALRLASLLQPAVVVAEDIDRVLPQQRTESVNAFLNTLDGVLSKSAKIIAVVTTNYLEEINVVALRGGGRFGAHIELPPLDVEAAGRFIARFAGEHLADPENIPVAAKVMADARLVPAMAQQALDNIRGLLVYERGMDINGHLTTEHIVRAVNSMRDQLALLDRDTRISPNHFESMTADFVDSVTRSVMNELDKRFKDDSPCR